MRNILFIIFILIECGTHLELDLLSEYERIILVGQEEVLKYMINPSGNYPLGERFLVRSWHCLWRPHTARTRSAP